MGGPPRLASARITRQNWRHTGRHSTLSLYLKGLILFRQKAPTGVDNRPPIWLNIGLVTRFEAALEIGRFHARPFATLVMPERQSIDIDTPLDLALAETIYRQLCACPTREGDA